MPLQWELDALLSQLQGTRFTTNKGSSYLSHVAITVHFSGVSSYYIQIQDILQALLLGVLTE